MKTQKSEVRGPKNRPGRKSSRKQSKGAIKMIPMHIHYPDERGVMLAGWFSLIMEDYAINLGNEFPRHVIPDE
jgi:hypothetical protein